MPRLVIVAGPNGSGKTTLVQSGVLSRVLDIPLASINPDDVARELADGGQPTPEQSLCAAQLCDARLDAEIAGGRSVIVESVLSSDKFKSRVAAALAGGYEIVFIYVTVRSAALNVARVLLRTELGGHAVPEDRIIARRDRSHGMFAWFAERADRVFVFDNSETVPVITACKHLGTWSLLHIDRLPGDLALTVRRLARARKPSRDG
jgi:predicted ABC-type ATPase